MITEERETYIVQMLIKKNFKKEKPIIISKSFSERVGKDSTSFLKNLMMDVKANS